MLRLAAQVPRRFGQVTPATRASLIFSSKAFPDCLLAPSRASNAIRQKTRFDRYTPTRAIAPPHRV
jgi:hypothetical protein